MWVLSWIVWNIFAYESSDQVTLSDGSFWDYTNRYGAFLGIVSNILVGVLAALIPSRVEEIAERLQSPLVDFQDIYDQAYELLTWVGDQPGSTFIMTSATPIFGIELDDGRRSKWENALKKRIIDNQKDGNIITELLCLDPDSNEGLGQSALWKFCEELESSGWLQRTDIKTSSALYKRSMDAFLSFSRLFEEPQSYFKLVCGPSPALHFVLATNRDGEKRGILYFAGIKSELKGLQVSGFKTTDERWLSLVNVVHRHISAQGWDALLAFQEDKRSPEQKARCMKLLEYQLMKEHRRTYNVTIGEYNISVYPDVFPPEIGHGTEPLLRAIRKTGLRWREAHSQTNQTVSFYGIDVGTGTGILALELAKFCDQVYGTDISATAVKNASFNTRNANNIKIYHSDLIKLVPPIPKNVFTILVFNYPFYPSPLAVYNSLARSRGGLTTVEDLFNELDSVITGDSVLIMPYHPIAEGNDPSTIAKRKGFNIVTLEPYTPDKGTVYAFTKSQDVANLLSA
ncbi:MAG TPA: methyltransferase domain-containing protein [Turneriella sp.]|nr:methyltransferase domain-containing protein [Turneriella sp.]